MQDNRSSNPTPQELKNLFGGRQFVVEFKMNSAIGIDTGFTYPYGVLISVIPWTNYTGGNIIQLYFTNNRFYRRNSSNDWSSWGSWVAV